MSITPNSKNGSTLSRNGMNGSTVSRRQSLIKKSVAPQDLRPSDVLIDRFVSWKAVVKQLVDYFERIADIENNIAKEYTKLAAVIQVPFRSGTQFLGEGGMQDVYYGIRDKTRVIADQHANLGRIVDSAIVQHLQKLHTDIKVHIKNVQNDTGKLATGVTKERELSARMIGELATSVSIFKNTPMSMTNKTDPYVANIAVMRQLQKQVHEENALQKSIIIMQQNSAHFERGIIHGVQSAWQMFEEWRSRMADSVQDIWQTMGRNMVSLAPDREWIAFSARSDHLLDPDTPLRNPETIQYPSKGDPSVLPVHIGLLERKKRFTRTYREAYYVLTAAGFLHEFPTSDPFQPGVSHTPVFSLFLPECTLGPPSTGSSKSHKFHIDGQKDGAAATTTTTTKRKPSLKLPMVGGRHAWSFRFRSHEDMMDWWNDIRMLCARYLVASEQADRGGPVEAAVRCAGYISEEDEEYEEERGRDENGFSVQDEKDENGMEDEDDLYQDAVVDVDEKEKEKEKAQPPPPPPPPPSYSNRGRNSNSFTAKDVHLDGIAQEHRAPSMNTNHEHQHRTHDDDDDMHAHASQRQQEKAPEGRLPHGDTTVPMSASGGEDDAEGKGKGEGEGEGKAPSEHEERKSDASPGPAPPESRFNEDLT